MTRVEDSLGILERLSFPNIAIEAYIPCSLDTLIYAPGKHAFKSPRIFQNVAHHRSRDHVPVSDAEFIGAPNLFQHHYTIGRKSLASSRARNNRRSVHAVLV